MFFSFQEGVTDPPSVSSISRLLRGGGMGDRKEDDSRKDYSIHGILGGEYIVENKNLIMIFSFVYLQYTVGQKFINLIQYRLFFF
jgi:hypothetical protein